MITMLVGQNDRIESRRILTHLLKPFDSLASAQTTVDQNPRLAGNHEGRVSCTAASERANPHYWSFSLILTGLIWLIGSFGSTRSRLRVVCSTMLAFGIDGEPGSVAISGVLTGNCPVSGT